MTFTVDYKHNAHDFFSLFPVSAWIKIWAAAPIGVIDFCLCSYKNTTLFKSRKTERASIIPKCDDFELSL